MTKWRRSAVLIITTGCVFALQVSARAAGKPASQQQSDVATAGRTATLKRVRVDSAGPVRLIVELDAPVRYSTGTAQNPDRIYIDLESTRPAADVPRRESMSSKMVRQIRVGQREGTVTRVVLDLASPASYSVSMNAGNIVVALEEQASSAQAAATAPGDSNSREVRKSRVPTAPPATAVPPATPAARAGGMQPSVRQNSSRAFPEVLKAAQAGSAAAQFAVANAYLEGRGVPVDRSEAVKWYRRAAEQGHTGAQSRLAFAYLNGMGTKQDDAEAVKWFRKAAGQGDVAGEYNLGAAYLHGRGVSVNYGEAAKWLRLAADHGFPEAQYALGTLYANGRGVPHDNAAAQTWLKRAADQNFARAQLALGKLYLGAERGGAQAAAGGDAGDAAVWIEKAAKQGLPEAQLLLARMFRDGLGVRRSGPDAVNWFTRAAHQGGTEAPYAMGAMYRDANAVPRDVVTACAWFAIAASQGDQRAREELEAITKSMSPTQVAAAQHQAQVLAAGLGK